MNITINNQDRTTELKARIEQGMQSHSDRPPPVQVPAELNALALRDARTQSEYQETLTRLIRYRDNVDTMPFDIPNRGGWIGKIAVLFKKVWWKLLRYQHDRITFRQNLINSLYASALEYERDQRRSEVAALETRIKKLEEGGNK